jgi:small basic protein
MWLILALLIGMLLGFIIPVDFPLEYSKYVSVAFLAGLDSVLGGVRAGVEKKFNGLIFITGFLCNVLFAALLTWVGDRLGVDLYLAAVVTFGVRIFQNLAYIRRDLISAKEPKPIIEEPKT